MAAAVEHLQGVLQRSDHGFKIFLGGRLAAGEIYYKGVAPQPGHGTGQHGSGCNFKTLIAHGFRNTRRFTLNNGERGLRGDITPGKPGAASGEHQIRPYFVGTVDKLKLDLTYIQNYSVWLDIKLMLLTLKILFTPESTEGVEENQITAMKEEKDQEER